MASSNSTLVAVTSILWMAAGATGVVLYFTSSKIFESSRPTNNTPREKLSKSPEITEEKIVPVEATGVGIGISHPSARLPQYKSCVYLDYNATTPIFPEVTTVMLPFLSTSFGNPSSNHVYSLPCKEAIDISRCHMKAMINAPSSSMLVFTSCGSESDNRAVDIAIHHYSGSRNTKPHIITSAIEHPAILGYLNHLVKSNVIDLDIIPVNEEGFVDVSSISQYLRTSTALVTIMHSNNEVGTIQPIQSISKAIKQFNAKNCCDILFHVDGAQSIGKVPVDVVSEGIDMLTIVGHKFGAPKGIAALYIRQDIRIIPLLVGGGQEYGIRAGTENVLLISGIGEAARLARQELDLLSVHMLTLKIRLMRLLEEGFKSKNITYQFNGPKNSTNVKTLLSYLKIIRSIQNTKKFANGLMKTPEISDVRSLSGSSGISSVIDQLPNTVSVSFHNIKAYQLLDLLHDQVACSAGSACHTSGAGEHISPVLKAMNIDSSFALGTLRLSLGRHTTTDEVEVAAKHILAAVTLLLENPNSSKCTTLQKI